MSDTVAMALVVGAIIGTIGLIIYWVRSVDFSDED